MGAPVLIEKYYNHYSDELITPEEILKLKNNSDKSHGVQDILMELEKRDYAYNSSIEVTPHGLVVKDYFEPIFRNYSMEKFNYASEGFVNMCQKQYEKLLEHYGEDIPEKWSTFDKFLDGQIKVWKGEDSGLTYSDLSEEEKRIENLKRVSRRQKKNIRGVFECNLDYWITFTTFTLGYVDFYEYISSLFYKTKSRNRTLDKNVFSCEELKQLQGVTDIRYKYSPVPEELRKKVVQVLGNFGGFFRFIDDDKYKYKSQKLREVARLLNTLICRIDDINDINSVNDRFDLFRRKMSRLLGDFKYLYVIERQPHSRKVHLHMVSNIPFDLSNIELQKIWGNGICDIQEINKDDDKLLSYLIKQLTTYITKDINSNSDIVGSNKNLYRCSQGLNRPQEITDEIEIKIVKEVLQDLSPSWNNEGKAVVGESRFSKDFYIKKYDVNIYDVLIDVRDKFVGKIINDCSSNSLTRKEIFNYRGDYLKFLRSELLHYFYKNNLRE